MLKIAAAAIMVCALAGAALAASDWTFENVSFTPREGWCPALAMQDNAPALEARPCEQDFPSLSIVLGQRNAARQDMAVLAATDAGKAAGDDNKKRVLDTVGARTGADDCTENSFAVDRAPMPGVAAFSVAASFICNGNEDAPALFHLFTAYAQRRDGSIWTVSFDHPGSPISNNDRAMIKAAIAKISGR